MSWQQSPVEPGKESILVLDKFVIFRYRLAEDVAVDRLFSTMGNVFVLVVIAILI
jgi:hypothetical protein